MTPNPGFKVTVYFRRRISKTVRFRCTSSNCRYFTYITPINLPLTRGPSAIAEFLVNCRLHNLGLDWIGLDLAKWTRVQLRVSPSSPRYRLDSYGRRCFAVAGPSTWNSLPDSIRDPAQPLSLSIFRLQLKTHFFAKYWRHVLLSALGIFSGETRMRYIICDALYQFTLYLLTYLRKIEQ